MTVCIGALADNGKSIVAVADKMISINAPMAYQYENDDVQKIFDLDEKSVAMYAGATNLATEIIEIARAKIAETKPQTVEKIASTVKDAYHEYRIRLLTQAVLQPHNLTLKDYMDTQKNLNQEVVNSIEKSLTEFNLGIEFIVCGIDDTGGHVYNVSNPGISVLNDGVGYACIGIGAPHALYSLIDSGYVKSATKEKVEEMVDLAKKRSENAPGVGKMTAKKVLSSKQEKGKK